jgi:hypothetical protein
MGTNGLFALTQVTNFRGVRLSKHRFAATTVTNRVRLTVIVAQLPTQVE